MDDLKHLLKDEWPYALAVALLAALPRIYRLDLVEFKLDEARHYHMAYHLTRGAWRWVGSTSSVGFPKPPLFIYTIGLPLSITRDPRVATGFLGLLAAMAAGVCYLVLRHWLGRKAALGSVILFALNPYAVLYGRKLFTADLLPPLCALFLATGAIWLESKPRQVTWLAPVVTLSFALIVLTTFSPLILLPALALLLWERRGALMKHRWALATAAVGLVVPFVPYLIAVWDRLRRALPQAGAMLDRTASATLPSGRPIHRWLWGMLYGTDGPAHPFTLGGAVGLMLGALSLVGLGWLLWNALRKDRGWARFVLVWLAGAPLLLLIVPVEVHPHYMLVLYPLLFALPAAGIRLMEREHPSLGTVALIAAALIGLWQGAAWLEYLDQAAEGMEGYGTPLGTWRRAAETARWLAEEEDVREILLLMPGDASWDEPATILDALLSGTARRVIDGRRAAIYPSHDALLVIAPAASAGGQLAEPCTTDLGVERPASPSGGMYRYRLWRSAEAGPDACAAPLTAASTRWGSGVELLAYGVEGTPAPGETLSVTLYWRTHQGPLEADVHWFIHLLGREEARWGQFDGVGWPSSRWRPGDRVMTRFQVPIAPEAPPGPYMLRVGQYTFPAIENIPTVDEAGNPADYAATLPVPIE